MIQNLSQAAGAPVSVSFTPTLVPMSRGILATCSAKLAPGADAEAARAAYEKAYADEPFVHLLPEGQWPTTAQVLGANTVALQIAVDPDAGRLVVVAAVDNLTKGTGGRGAPVRQPRPRPARDHRPPARRSRAVSVTAPKGFSAAGVAAGLKSSGDPDVAVVLNHGPDDAAAAVFTTNRFPAAPVLWSRQVLAGERARAVVLNSGGANACTGPEGFQDTHATAEHAAAELGIGAIDVAVASTGLIGVRLPMDKLTAGVTAAVQALVRGGRSRRRPGDHDHRPRAEDDRAAAGRLDRSAAWPRAPACSRRRWPRCSSSSPPTPSSPPDVLGPALKHGDQRQLRARRLRRLPVDQRHGDRAGQRRERDHARPPRSSPRRSPRRPPTSRCSCSPTPRARPRTSRSPSATPPASRTP